MIDSRFWNGKRVLITGHTGFKGSWLSIWLNRCGAEVYGYALEPRSGSDNYVACRLETIVKGIEGDVRKRSHLQSVFKQVEPDIAFHMAAQSLVLESYRDAHYTYETNVMGTVNFLDAVRMTPSVRAAVNITSDKCYDNNDWVWGYRESDAMGGDDPYSSSKGCAEIITTAYRRSFFREHETGIATARAGNCIGAGDWAAHRIVPDYFRALKKKDPLVIRNPNMTRPWQHVLEPLSGYLLLAQKMYGANRYAGGWNFGPLDEMNFSVLELVEKMQQFDTQGRYHIPDGSADHPHEAKHLKLDISKAVNLLGWRPVFSFDDTVKFTVSGYLNDIQGRKDPLENRIETIEAFEAESAKHMKTRERIRCLENR